MKPFEKYTIRNPKNAYEHYKRKVECILISLSVLVMNRQKSVGKFKYFHDEYYTESQPVSKPATHRDLIIENKNV